MCNLRKRSLIWNDLLTSPICGFAPRQWRRQDLVRGGTKLRVIFTGQATTRRSVSHPVCVSATLALAAKVMCSIQCSLVVIYRCVNQ